MGPNPEAQSVPEPAGSPLRGGPDSSPLIPKVPVWLRVVPFFLSAVLFLSAFLAVFSPLPILLLGFSRSRDAVSLELRRGWIALACVSNSALVYWMGGESGLAIYLVFVLTSSLAMLELLARGKRVEVAAGGALLSMVLAAVAVILFYSQIHQIHPVVEIRNAVSSFVDYWIRTVSTDASRVAQLPSQDPAEIEAWKQGLIIELPSAVAVLALVLVWVNLAAVLQLNPRGIRARLGVRPDFFQYWKSPEWLIWPTIVSGATLLLDLGIVTDVGRNIFKFLMAIYAIQGLSILSFFFSLWKLKRLLRFGGYLVAVLLMMPLLLSLGFFDLWFDFRAKFRQS